MTAPAYSVEWCIAKVEHIRNLLAGEGWESILHHLRAAQTAASREAEIRAEAWEEGYRASDSDQAVRERWVNEQIEEVRPPKSTANPYRPKP